MAVTFALEVFFMHFLDFTLLLSKFVSRGNTYSQETASLSKEVAVLKKYPNKSPKKVLIAKKELLQSQGWSGNADASKKSASLKYLL